LKIEEYIQRAPHSYFFVSFADADLDLEYLEDFTESTVEFLGRAAVEAATKTRDLSDGLKAIASDAEYLYGALYASDVHQASIIASIIFLERQMKDFTRGLKFGLQLGLGMRDLSGSLLERFRKYCEKVARLDFGLQAVEWQNMRGVVEIRNCLVHSSGNLDHFNKKQEVIAFAERHGTPRIEASWVRVEEATVRVVLKLLKDFIESIYKCALKRFPKESDRLSVPEGEVDGSAGEVEG